MGVEISDLKKKLIIGTILKHTYRSFEKFV